MSEKLLFTPVTDEERRAFTPKNITDAFEKHYGRGYGSSSPVQGPINEGATFFEDSLIMSRPEYGTPDDAFKSDYVQGIVLSSLVKRVSQRHDA